MLMFSDFVLLLFALRCSVVVACVLLGGSLLSGFEFDIRLCLTCGAQRAAILLVDDVMQFSV
ncbi:hypothetical protein TSUD_28590 [Trifolium subterraneum]|uniref:Uncharacterized protein n=1 Tax=Trifolium subterraneum TaxID=3900 RepID=A0A2Z6PUP2_TRISU|nr:hypothetical protein TSUD_28590 [Trifolium subterraneum]